MGARLKAAYRNRGKEQHPPALPLQSLVISKSLLTAPPAGRSNAGAVAAAAAEAAAAAAASVAAAAAANGGSEARRGDGCSISRRTDSRRHCRPVTGLEMIERGLDESGSSTTSSTTAATTSSSSTSSVKSGAGTTSSWATRSKLPFHKLPFEVQQYHLAQRLHVNPSRRPSSAAAAPAATAPPAEDEDESAVVESAWFPLMPPAMAGEARQPEPLAASQQRQVVTDGTGTVVGPCETDTNCSAGRAPGGEGVRQGSERCWDTMEG